LDRTDNCQIATSLYLAVERGSGYDKRRDLSKRRSRVVAHDLIE